jgi:putative transposase
VPQVGHQRGDLLRLWKKKYGELSTSELRKMRQLEKQDARLKRLVADLTLDKVMLQDLLSRKS